MKWLCVDGLGGGCRIDGDVEMGQSKLSDWTMEMQQVPGCYQTSMLLLEKCKCLMTEKWNRCDKQPGSWIKVNAKVQSYLVAGQRHAQMSDICAEISGCQDAKVCLTSFAKWLAHFQQKFVNERILSLFLPHTHIHRQRQRQRVLVVF
jgi:hypothetical protein